MYTPRQIWRRVTPKAQVLIALALATILAFSAGLASGIYGRVIYPPALTSNGNAAPAVAQPHQAAPAVQQRPAVAAPQTSPNVPLIGTGSVYDGGHYHSAPRRSPNLPVIGTGSAYDGGHYGSSISAPRTAPNVPTSGTGSAYDGR